MNNGDTLFNWIQSANSVPRSTTAGLLAIGLVISTFCLAPGTASAATLAADTTIAEPPEEVLSILRQTFSGYIAVSFPADSSGSCLIVEASPYQKRWKEFFQTWYSVSVEARCPGEGTQQTVLWIECTERRNLVCELRTPPPETLAAINDGKTTP